MSEKTYDPMELARHVLVMASQFAKAAMDSYQAEHPERAATIDLTPGLKLGVRVDDLMSASPRVSLIIVQPNGGAELELGSAELRVPKRATSSH